MLIDTCVLYPSILRDTLLQLAERGLFQPLWSQDILDELRRNLVYRVIKTDAFDHLINQMAIAFDESCVINYGHLIAEMKCELKDRHVLAAALVAQADVIITFNTKDFPPNSTEELAVDILSPDDFLLELLETSEDIVLSVLRQQGVRNRQPPQTLDEILNALMRAGVPLFTSAVSSLRN